MTGTGVIPVQETLPALHDFSTLAGPLEEPGEGAYRVRYRTVRRRGGAKLPLLVALTVGFEAFFVWWLLHPQHRAPAASGFAAVVQHFLLVSIGLMELLRLVNVVSLSIASLVARDPVPVRPDTTLRVAFVTTIVPGKEPVAIVRNTLLAARRIRYGGRLDVWILDEGDDDEVKAVAAELGVHHFSRKGVARYNRPNGPFRAKTKHGNYNAWLDAHGHQYDVFLSVDPDHVPLPNYAERMLGYFRDPDVAYVVGPQCYRNVGTFVTRGAESQQFPFHSVIQRAANRYDAAMLVGTNNAVRIAALRSVGGLADSITEDMATGIALHSSENPRTGRLWKSVYTPDVVAAGEGPSSWGDYFSQQMRWSRGTFEILLTTFWRRFFRLSPGRMLHYGMITAFYPAMAIGWILGAVNATLTLALGVQAIIVPASIWIALYVDVTAFQLWLYMSNRRYNVSPYENEEDTGLRGIIMSIIAAPMYASQLVATILRRPARFVVTPKGCSATTDSLPVFRRHLQWFLLVAGALVVGLTQGFATPLAAGWVAVTLLVCLAPIALWQHERWWAGPRRARVAAAVATPAPVLHLEPPLRSAPTLADVPVGTPRRARAPGPRTRLTVLIRDGARTLAPRGAAARAWTRLGILVWHGAMLREHGRQRAPHPVIVGKAASNSRVTEPHTPASPPRATRSTLPPAAAPPVRRDSAGRDGAGGRQRPSGVHPGRGVHQ